MPTFKTVVNMQRRRDDGTYSVKIRITHNRVTRYMATGIVVAAADIARGGNITDARVADLSYALLKKYRDICNEYSMLLMPMNVDEVVRFLEAKTAEGDGFHLDMVKYMRQRIAELQAEGRHGTAAAMSQACDTLDDYTGGKGIDVNSITRRFVAEWRAWIRQRARDKGYSGESAAWAYAVQLRTAFNRARREFNDEDASVINIHRSPFVDMERPMCVRSGAAHKRALTLAQMIGLLEMPRRDEWLKGNTAFNLARDCFTLSFLLLGMNPADLYDCRTMADGRITYNRVKTRRRRVDGAEMSVLVPPEAQALVARYRDTDGGRVFNFHRRYSTAKSFYNALQRGMKELETASGIEGLQFYAARHTWATLAVNNAGVDKYTVHEALNHTDGLMRITDIYIRRDWSVIDAAARRVLDLFPHDITWG